MAYTPGKEENALDIRIYIGMLFFRWQIIVVCFLYALLAGVLYLQFTPREYVARCRLMRYQERDIPVARPKSPWVTYSSFVYLLRSPELRAQVVRELSDEWGEIMGSRRDMMLPVHVARSRALGTTMDISVRTKDPGYGEAFLTRLLELHEPEWNGIQKNAAESAVKFLEDELSRLEEKIKQAQDDLIEYQRLHDIARVDARGSAESAYLNALVSRRSQLGTELTLLEQQYPVLRDASIGVISHVDQLTRETGELEPIEDFSDEDVLDALATDTEAGGERSSAGADGARGPDRQGTTLKAMTLEDALERAEPDVDDGMGWPRKRVLLAQLEREEADLARDLEENHPRRRALRERIQKVKDELDMLARVKLQNLRDRHQALKLQLDAVEAAEYKWQAKNLYASQRRTELKRVANVVSRFESNYATVYKRLHDLRVSEELKAEHYSILEPPRASSKPVYPDTQKILLAAVALGLGSGFGLALLLQVLDNKVQSIKDVEKTLGIPFLGGVPFWVHSGLEKAIRPIVTEERATGAIEAYRALRTTILAALKKVNEKIVIVTSADSREGKTLTTLNLAIMVAEMGKNVLIIDMDLRRGRLHRSLGIERDPGVTDALLNDGSLRDVIRPTRVENLYLAPVGQTIENSAELLQGSNLVEKLVEIQDDYDYIFVDTSPVLRVTDTVVVATMGIGAVVYVARVNHTPKPLIRYSLDMLGDAHVLGLIMNSIEMHKISSLYYAYQYPNYAYYSNAYAYGYNYYHHDDTGGGRRRVGHRSRWKRRMQSATKWLRQTFLPVD